MLDFAYKYKAKLDEIYLNKVVGNDFYKYFTDSDYIQFTSRLGEDNTEWNKIERVSIFNNEILGYIGCDINRSRNYASHFKLLGFAQSYILTKDVLLFVDSLFNKYKINKLNWMVNDGNPAKGLYDRFIERWGGRLVGYYEDEATIDGKYCKCYIYELMAKDYRSCLKQ